MTAPARLPGAPDLLADPIERAHDIADRRRGNACIKRRRVELGVTQQHLNDTNIDVLFQEMRGKAVPQRMQRYLLVDACHIGGKTLVSAAILRFDGQLSTFKSHKGGDHPCYRCIFPEAPPPGLIPSCAEGGVLGALAGIMGSLQATEIMKELLGIGESLSGTLLIYDGLTTSFRKVKVRPDPACKLCGAQATIADLSSHAA